METEVIMKRKLFGNPISQKSKSEFFSATDLVLAGNKWRAKKGLSLFNLSEFFRRKGTIEFMSSLEEKYGKIKISGRGKGKHTWVHPLLFIDIALSISPKLKIETYEWLFDQLIKNRNDSGDSYKKMCGALYLNQKNKSEFSTYISDVALLIKEKCKVADWETATQEQLGLRNDLHKEISLLTNVLRDNAKAVHLALIQH